MARVDVIIYAIIYMCIFYLSIDQPTDVEFFFLLFVLRLTF